MVDNLKEEEYDIFTQMVLDFYNEDSNGFGESYMTKEKVQNTISRSITHSNQLIIKILKDLDKVIGYSILSSYWSNEYGGLVCILDELYIKPEYRNKGKSSAFLKALYEDLTYVLIQLEVFHDNPKAQKLYTKMGFEIIDRVFMKKQNLSNSFLINI
jgi:GNAT superfamily N-acetyltransferase